MAALPLIVFDVNETLLDLETMEPTFERIFGEKSAMRLWALLDEVSTDPTAGRNYETALPIQLLDRDPYCFEVVYIEDNGALGVPAIKGPAGPGRRCRQPGQGR